MARLATLPPHLSGADPREADPSEADAREAGRAAPDDGLFARASAVATNAHAPYSRFFVGAAVRSLSGAVYTAANVENVSYPVGTCAEAGAIAAAQSAEGERFAIAAIAIAAHDARGVAQPCSPCGACRQRIAEFSTDAAVTFRGASGALVCEPIGVLLPYQFAFQPHGS